MITKRISRNTFYITAFVLSAAAVIAYDGWGDSNPNISDPGLAARFLWIDTVEDDHSEQLIANYEGDHLASVVANLNYAAWKQSYAVGDFDGNGCLDLAIGIPYATVAGTPAAGQVRVLFYRPVAAAPPPGGWTTPGPQVTCKANHQEIYSMGEPPGRRLMYGQPDKEFYPQKGATASPILP
jgi:FG-GAP repeat